MPQFSFSSLTQDISPKSSSPYKHSQLWSPKPDHRLQNFKGTLNKQSMNIKDNFYSSNLINWCWSVGVDLLKSNLDQSLSKLSYISKESRLSAKYTTLSSASPSETPEYLGNLCLPSRCYSQAWRTFWALRFCNTYLCGFSISILYLNDTKLKYTNNIYSLSCNYSQILPNILLNWLLKQTIISMTSIIRCSRSDKTVPTEPNYSLDITRKENKTLQKSQLHSTRKSESKRRKCIYYSTWDW